MLARAEAEDEEWGEEELSNAMARADVEFVCVKNALPEIYHPYHTSFLRTGGGQDGGAASKGAGSASSGRRRHYYAPGRRGPS
mmetsp:Transcript_53615/g.148251  ORF Transcript_53615/g.148251 Transcript_53615/m.148251 type:complete len:83 (+) Transcript_53615:293-541(+)